MKKRQKPILMVTILAVFAVSAVGINLLQNPPKPDSHAHEAEEPKTEEVLSAPRNSADPKAVAQNAADAMKPSAGTPVAAPPRPNMPKASLLRPQMGKANKPKPNSSSTGSQWWSEEHTQEMPDN